MSIVNTVEDFLLYHLNPNNKVTNGKSVFIPDYIRRLPNAPHFTVNTGITIAKDLLGENKPYFIKRTTYGETVILTQHFWNAINTALVLGDVSYMNKQELGMFEAYKQYQYNIQTGVTDTGLTAEQIKASQTIDKWINDAMQGQYYYGTPPSLLNTVTTVNNTNNIIDYGVLYGY